MKTARLLTLNLWGAEPPLDRRLELLVEGARTLGADVIALQEVRSVPGTVPNTAETIAAQLGYSWVWAPATEWGGGEEGLALLSRWPIVHQAHRELPHALPTERRVVLGAAVMTPIGELAVFTTHLNYRLTDGAKREDQVAAVDGFVTDWVASRPTSLPRLLAGDFNATPDSDEIRYLRGLHSIAWKRTYYQDAWAACHRDQPGYTWARKNPQTAGLHWLERDRRIDYILVSPLARDGRGEVLDCRLAFDQPASDGMFASDHFGLLADIRLGA